MQGKKSIQKGYIEEKDGKAAAKENDGYWSNFLAHWTSKEKKVSQCHWAQSRSHPSHFAKGPSLSFGSKKKAQPVACGAKII